MMIENNMTMIVEGKIACCCQMKWMYEMLTRHPELIVIDRSRAICSREGTDLKMNELFWKTPTVFNFLKAMEEDKNGSMCKKST